MKKVMDIFEYIGIDSKFLFIYTIRTRAGANSEK